MFGGTDVGRQPTEHRHRYVVLRFNFSAFKTALDGLEHHFEEYAALEVMRKWYNGYRFARRAEGDLYNTDMVLYYLCDSLLFRTRWLRGWLPRAFTRSVASDARPCIDGGVCQSAGCTE